MWRDRPNRAELGGLAVDSGYANVCLAEGCCRHPEHPLALIEFDQCRRRRREPVPDHLPVPGVSRPVLDPVVGDLGALRNRPRQRHPTYARRRLEARRCTRQVIQRRKVARVRPLAPPDGVLHPHLHHVLAKRQPRHSHSPFETSALDDHRSRKVPGTTSTTTVP